MCVPVARALETTAALPATSQERPSAFPAVRRTMAAAAAIRSVSSGK